MGDLNTVLENVTGGFGLTELLYVVPIYMRKLYKDIKIVFPFYFFPIIYRCVQIITLFLSYLHKLSIYNSGLRP